MHVFLHHARDPQPKGCGWCARGVKVWCEQHGLNFRELARTGCSVELLEALDDPFANRLVALVRAEHERK